MRREGRTRAKRRVVDDQGRARGHELLKELVRRLVEEMEAGGEMVVPRDVAERALRGFQGTSHEEDKQVLLQEIVDYVRALGRPRT
jgi:hypothetical protein